MGREKDILARLKGNNAYYVEENNKQFHLTWVTCQKGKKGELRLDVWVWHCQVAFWILDFIVFEMWNH